MIIQHLRYETEKCRLEFVIVDDVRRNETGHGDGSEQCIHTEFRILPNQVRDEYAKNAQMQVARQIPRLNHTLFGNISTRCVLILISGTKYSLDFYCFFFFVFTLTGCST